MDFTLFQVSSECSPPHSQGSQPLTASIPTISGSGELTLTGVPGVLAGLVQLPDTTSMEELPHDSAVLK